MSKDVKKLHERQEHMNERAKLFLEWFDNQLAKFFADYGNGGTRNVWRNI